MAGRPGANAEVVRWSRWVSLAVVAQVTAGVVNIILSAPGWMQIVHLVLGTLLWVAFVILCGAVMAKPRAA